MIRPYAVILAGGEGVRFSPYSTSKKPKQFLIILDASRSMIQQTYDRLDNFIFPDRIFVSTNGQYCPLVGEQLPKIHPSHVLGEPVKKNTAPAMALMTWLISRNNPEGVVLFLPSDHYIKNVSLALDLFQKGVDLAGREPCLVTFGVPPSFASTDYGYIQCNRAVSSDYYLFVEKFVEKPTVEKAEFFLKEGSYYWNSGIFAWNVQTFLSLLKKYLPGIAKNLDKLKMDDNKGEVDRDSLLDYFNSVESVSIDYGMMEKAAEIKMFPFPVGWSDVGTWKGLADLAQREKLNLPPEILPYLVFE